MGRNNKDFHEGKNPTWQDVEAAHADKKISNIEAHTLLGGDLDPKDSGGYDEDGPHVYRAGTPLSRGDMDESDHRQVHKNAGLKSDW